MQTFGGSIDCQMGSFRTSRGSAPWKRIGGRWGWAGSRERGRFMGEMVFGGDLKQGVCRQRGPCEESQRLCTLLGHVVVEWDVGWLELCCLQELEPSPAPASWVSLNYPGGDFPDTERLRRKNYCCVGVRVRHVIRTETMGSVESSAYATEPVE